MPEQLRFDAVSMRAVEKMERAIPIAVERVKRYLVLLTTSKSAPAYQQLTPELEWREPIPLPNTVQMILAIGRRMFHVEQVLKGTTFRSFITNANDGGFSR